MPDDSDFLLIIAHGAEGTLDCSGQRLAIAYEAGNEKPITHLASELETKTVKQMTVLLTCHGATAGYNGISLANIFADKTNSIVRAAKNAKVNYLKGTGYPYLSGEKTWEKLVNFFFRGSWPYIFPKLE